MDEDVRELKQENYLQMFNGYVAYDGTIVRGVPDHFPEVKGLVEDGKINREHPFWDNPEIEWFKKEQCGSELKELPCKQGASWGSGIIAVFPDDCWTYYSQDWDSSG